MSIKAELKAISERIDAHDRFHTLEVRNRSQNFVSITNEIDKFVTSLTGTNGLAFSGLGEEWREFNSDEARLILVDILSNDIAYGTPEIPADTATEIAAEFLAIFAANSCFFQTETSIGQQEVGADTVAWRTRHLKQGSLSWMRRELDCSGVTTKTNDETYGYHHRNS